MKQRFQRLLTLLLLAPIAIHAQELATESHKIYDALDSENLERGIY